MNRGLKVGTTVLVALIVAGCAGTDYATQSRIEKALDRDSQPVEQYRVGPADVLRIVVWRNEDLTVQVPVRPDGRISVPLVGDIMARDKEPETLAKDIEGGLESFIRQPEVSVIVTRMQSKEFSNRVRVTGAVRQPASQPYREGMTVMDIVLGAGGTTEFASADDATLYRRLDDDVVAISVDLDAILNEGDIATNYQLVPGDIVTVPESSF